MDLPKTVIKFPMVAGLDTRTDPCQLEAPKFASADNCFLANPRALKKRSGYAQLASSTATSTARFLYTRGDELVLTDGTGSFSFLASASSWVAKSGTQTGSSPLPQVSCRYGQVFDQQSGSVSSQSAILGASDIAHIPGYYLVTSLLASGSNGVKWVAYDDTTGAIAASGTIASIVAARLFSFGSSVLMVVQDVSGSARVDAYVFQMVGGIPAIGPRQAIVTDAGTNHVIDVAARPGDVILAYQSTTATTIKYGSISPQGVYAQLGTQATATEPETISVACEPTTQSFGITWGMQGATMRIDSRIFSSAGTGLFAAATITTGLPAVQSLNNLTSCFSSPTLLNIWFDYTQTGQLVSVYFSSINTSGTVAGPTVASHLAFIGSRAWNQTGVGPCLLLGAESTSGIQESYFLVCGGPTPSVLAAPKDIGTILLGPVFGTGAFAHNERPSPYVSGSKVYFALSMITQFPGVTGSSQGQFNVGLESVTFDFADQTAHQGIDLAGNHYSSGGFFRSYDGQTVAENVFFLSPEGTLAASSNAGGALLPSTLYAYAVVYECTGARGEIIQSAAIEFPTRTTGASDNTITLTIPTLQLTNRAGGIYVSVYRREQGGQNYHLVSARDPLFAAVPANGYVANSTAFAVTFVDKMAEATMTACELLPLSEDVTDNIAPPPSTILTTGNGRVFLSGMADPDLLWYSKTRGTGESLSFTDTNTLVVETGVGPITALGCLSDNLFIFRAFQIYVCGGDGLDNTGTTGSFTTPRLISEGIGCSNPRSIVTVGGILYFQSAKGIYALDASGGLSYVGADVELYNSETVTSAIAIPTSNQVRFTTANRTLVYDYELKAWFHWTIGAAGAVLWQNKHVLLPGTSSLTLLETSGTYQDNGLPYTLAIELPWVTPGEAGSSSQLRGRLWMSNFLGSYFGPHQVLVKIAFDYDPAFVEQHTWSPAPVFTSASGAYGGAPYGSGTYGGTTSLGINASSSYQFTVQPQRQRCQSVKLRVEDQPQGGAGVLGNSFGLSEISFVLGVNPGMPSIGVERRS